MNYKIGTRGSKLALVQAEYVKSTLQKAYPEHSFECVVIKTKGDLIQDRMLSEIGGKGLFVKEIEECLLRHEIDLAVHSMKDMPQAAPGLTFSRCWKRADARDVLVLREASSLQELPAGAVIGTGSLRRAGQLMRLRPDIRTVGIRGNVDTRIRKMNEQGLDGIVLAAAGLERLGLTHIVTQYLSVDEMIPAPAQGVLAIELRDDDESLMSMLNAFADDETDVTARVEREFLHAIGGDCHRPVGAFCCHQEDGSYKLCAYFGEEEGSEEGNLTSVTVQGAAEQLAVRALAVMKRRPMGRVELVGAGPGDAELITVKGLRLLRQADCVLYDRLSSPELLREVKPDCELIYVGKQDRHHTMPQEEINRLLIEKAFAHRLTVRLKGGDPYVFGRGGEEALALRGAGVSFGVVPGISSSIAGLTYAGIPITHRGLATGFRVITAHDKTDSMTKMDFDELARSDEDTCVFLMGLSKLEEIVKGLLDAGKSADTPAAVVSHATTSEQKTCRGTLNNICEEVRNAGLTSPALIVIGRTVSLREELNFFEKRPLWGRKYLLPRIGSEPSRLAGLLREAGARVDEVLVGRIRYLQPELPGQLLAGESYAILTSRHAVKGFMALLNKNRIDMRRLSGMKFAVVGAGTAQALEACGIRADYMPESYTGDDLWEILRHIVKKTDTVWHICGTRRSENALTRLMPDACCCRILEVYENSEVQADWTSVEVADYDRLLFTSASAVERTVQALGGRLPEAWMRDAAAVAIGPVCARAAARAGFVNVGCSNQATYEGMYEYLLREDGGNC